MQRDNEIKKSNDTKTKRAEIVIRFDVKDNEASQDYLDAVVGEIRRELRGHNELAQKSAEVEGRWL